MIKQIEEIKGDYNKEKQDEIKAIQLEILQAKKEYLTVLKNAREKYQKVVTPYAKFIKAKNRIFGENKSTYIGEEFRVFGFISYSGGYESAKVEQHELDNVLTYGRISSSIDRVIAECTKNK